MFAGEGCVALTIMLQIKDLSHTYRNEQNETLTALDQVSLDVAEGEFLAIIGRNGSGKSTLAKHLNALLIPDAGECLVAGMDTRKAEVLWDVRQTVGMVFQNPDNQIVASLVEEDVAFGPENLGLPPAEILRRVQSSLEMVGMSEYRLHAPHLLSGGQKQRVAIAGVLAMQPRCLVLDEPTAMLDPVGRSEVLAAVCKLHRQQGITVVLITHFMEEAVAADRVVVMDAGRIIMDSDPVTVFSQVDRIRALGLDVPIAADIAARLRCKGVAISPGIIRDEELAVALCP
jgi:energy-coupling factor transport system ATP-binding protein